MNASAVGTLVERTSGYLILARMRDATATSASGVALRVCNRPILLFDEVRISAAHRNKAL